MIEKIGVYFLPCAINILSVIYLMGKILKKKVSLNFKWLTFSFLLLVFVSIINYVFVPNSIRIITSIIYISVFSKYIFKDSYIEMLSAAIPLFIVIFFSEVLSYLLFMLLRIDAFLLSNQTFIGLLIMNTIISLTSVILYEVKIVLDFSIKIKNFFLKFGGKYKYVIILILLVSLNFTLIFMYYKLNNFLVILINFVFILIYTAIVYFLMKEKEENVKFKEENKNLIGNLNEYEKMLDYQRVNNHENKNQLLVIKSMVPKECQDVQDYIDEVIKEKREDNEILYTKAKRIPTGGLQGLIYQKMLVMQEDDILVELDVSRNIRDFDYSKISPKMNYDICRIVGIILDNAIEESRKISKKEIFISMYVESNIFCIEISNRFVGSIDPLKISDKGYTTKGKGHGYGLTLVKQIISNNRNITNETSIIKDIFTQSIKIKID